MIKITDDFFEQMSIRHIRGYIDYLEDNNQKMNERIFDLYNTIWKLESENDYYRNFTGIMPWKNQLK